MRSSQENPVRSHNRVVQGCAGEESRGAGAVLTPPPPTPHGSAVQFPGARGDKRPMLTVKVREILTLQPSLNLTPTERL